LGHPAFLLLAEARMVPLRLLALVLALAVFVVVAIAQRAALAAGLAFLTVAELVP
jgi:hypothetical protein